MLTEEQAQEGTRESEKLGDKIHQLCTEALKLDQKDGKFSDRLATVLTALTINTANVVACMRDKDPEEAVEFLKIQLLKEIKMFKGLLDKTKKARMQ